MHACNERLRVPQGEFEFARYPTPANETLRAWDAVDEFLLRHPFLIGFDADRLGGD